MSELRAFLQEVRQRFLGSSGAKASKERESAHIEHVSLFLLLLLLLGLTRWVGPSSV
jgi:hypothetical protein